MRKFGKKFIQLERFAPRLCTIERAQTNKVIWTFSFVVNEYIASQRPRILAKTVTIACVAKEILAEQNRPLEKKDKSKNNNERSTSGSNSKSTQLNVVTKIRITTKRMWIQ